MADDEDVLGIYGRLSNLRESKKHSKDRLKPLVDYTVEKLASRPIKICILYVFCQYSFATLLTIYHLLDKFDTQTLLKHGSFCGIQMFVLINLAPLLYMTDDILDFLRRYAKAALPIEMMNDSTLKQVLILIKFLKVITAIDMVFAIIAAAGFIAAPAYFDERTYLCVWIRETFPNYQNLLLQIVHWTSLPVALTLAGSSIGFCYGSSTAIFQILVLHEMISSISNSALPPKLRMDSELYQEAVRQKMIMAIMVHEYTVRFQALASEIVEIPMTMVAVGSLILGGSLMIEFLSNQHQNFGDHYEIYAGIFCFTIAGGISANIYLIMGQVIKDASAECYYKLCQLPWYDMNSANKKIYSIFLHRSNTNMAISNSLIQIDYELLVRICKSLYSLAAVLAQFVSTQEAE